MRRRKPVDDDPTPLELRRFVAAEWPAADELAAAGLWWAAHREYLERTGEHASIHDWSSAPDEPFDPDDL